MTDKEFEGVYSMHGLRGAMEHVINSVVTKFRYEGFDTSDRWLYEEAV